MSFTLDIKNFVEKAKKNPETVARQVSFKLFSAPPARLRGGVRPPFLGVAIRQGSSGRAGVALQGG